MQNPPKTLFFRAIRQQIALIPPKKVGNSLRKVEKLSPIDALGAKASRSFQSFWKSPRLGGNSFSFSVVAQIASVKVQSEFRSAKKTDRRRENSENSKRFSATLNYWSHSISMFCFPLKFTWVVQTIRESWNVTKITGNSKVQSEKKNVKIFSSLRKNFQGEKAFRESVLEGFAFHAEGKLLLENLAWSFVLW